MTTLNVTNALRLTQVLHASMHRTPVARMVVSNLPVDDAFDYEGTLFYGTANVVCDQDGEQITDDRDVRECYLKVALTSGHEEQWLIADLIDEVRDGHFIPNFQAEEQTA